MGFSVDLLISIPHKDLICGVCGDVMEQPTETECGHVFCYLCLTHWFQSSATQPHKTCPFCRAAIQHMKPARVLKNIIGDLVTQCEGKDNGCEWSGCTSQYLLHRKTCQYCPKLSAPQEQVPAPASDLSDGTMESLDSQATFSGWLCFLFFLCLGGIAGAQLAAGRVVATWAAMSFSLLGFFEPESTYLIIATTIYCILDMVDSIPAVVVFLLWGLCVCIPRFLPSLESMYKRAVPPVLVLRIGNIRFSSPTYYNLILLSVAASLGYYYMVQDVHRYMVTTCLLIQGVLLPFATRMYRARLLVDGMLEWRNGADDMGAFYLVASLYAGLDLFRTFLFTHGSVPYQVISFGTRWSAICIATVIAIEACVLGCTTRLQICAVLVPILILALHCPGL